MWFFLHMSRFPLLQIHVYHYALFCDCIWTSYFAIVCFSVVLSYNITDKNWLGAYIQPFFSGRYKVIGVPTFPSFHPSFHYPSSYLLFFLHHWMEFNKTFTESLLHIPIVLLVFLTLLIFSFYYNIKVLMMNYRWVISLEMHKNVTQDHLSSN